MLLGNVQEDITLVQLAIKNKNYSVLNSVYIKTYMVKSNCMHFQKCDFYECFYLKNSSLGSILVRYY